MSGRSKTACGFSAWSLRPTACKTSSWPPKQSLIAHPIRLWALTNYALALDAIARFHLEFWRLNLLSDGERHARHFDLGFASYLEKHALALTLIGLTINKPQFEKLFDEGSMEHGIQVGAYARLKWAVVHVEDVAKTLAAYQYLRVLAPANAALRKKERVYTFVLERLDERYVWGQQRRHRR